MKCPNCGTEIGRFELKQNCKNCGVNLFYIQQEEMLASDAKRCELEFASMRIFVAKLKTAFIGGPLQISRMVILVLCICALLVPFETVSTHLPLFEHKFTLSALGLYNAFSDGSLLALLDFAKIGVVSGIARSMMAQIAIMVIIVLSILVCFVTLVLSFVNIRKTAKIISVAAGVGAVVSLVAAVLGALLLGSAELQSITASAGAGGYICAAVFTALLIVNVMIIKRNIAPVYKQIDLDRVAMHKRVKKGEVKFTDLPLPVFESEEEREKRLAEEASKLDEKAVANHG